MSVCQWWWWLRTKGLLLLSTSSVKFSACNFPGPKEEKKGGCIDMCHAPILSLHGNSPPINFKSLALIEGEHSSSGCHYFLYHLVREKLKLCQ